jgi:hypothetical protein
VEAQGQVSNADSDDEYEFVIDPESGYPITIHWYLNGVNKDHSKYMAKYDLTPGKIIKPFQTYAHGAVLYRVKWVEKTDVGYVIRVHYEDLGTEYPDICTKCMGTGKRRADAMMDYFYDNDICDACKGSGK